MSAVITPFENWLATQPFCPNPAEPVWLTKFRQAHWDALQAEGLPKQKNERWKYTNLFQLLNQEFKPAEKEVSINLQSFIDERTLDQTSHLIVFVNGQYSSVYSKIKSAAIQILPLVQAIHDQPDIVHAVWPKAIEAKSHPFACLNAAIFSDGIFLNVPDEVQLASPIHLLFLTIPTAPSMTHPRHLIVLGKKSRATLLEEHVSFNEATVSSYSYFNNQVMTIYVDDGAHWSHVKIQNEHPQAFHLNHTAITQMSQSQVTHTTWSLGAMFARDDLTIALEKENAQCATNGFYFLNRTKQYIDHHVNIAHLAAESRSDMLYKGILNQPATAVFNGRLYVAKDAQKILAHQANHNMVLTPRAEVYSKPELEIYADNVKCKHGATIGQLDEAALFYLCARGIPRDEAIKMLLNGFTAEILQRITDLSIRNRISGLSDYHA